MNEVKAQILAYLRTHEGETFEDVLNALEDDILRAQLSVALAALIWSDALVRQNPTTGALTLRQAAR